MIQNHMMLRFEQMRLASYYTENFYINISQETYMRDFHTTFHYHTVNEPVSSSWFYKAIVLQRAKQ